MIFEIFKNDKRVMFTENEKCIPSEETISNMINTGYVIKKNGKKISAKKRKSN